MFLLQYVLPYMQLSAAVLFLTFDTAVNLLLEMQSCMLHGSAQSAASNCRISVICKFAGYENVSPEVMASARPLLTGNPAADADIIKFYQAKAALMNSQPLPLQLT